MFTVATCQPCTPAVFFFFFLYQEDAYLRKQYPVYADSSSAFEVLGAADEMEAKHRTHQQIKARVKKLGLTAASHAYTGGDSESAADTDNEPGDKDADMAYNAGGSDEAEKADDAGGSDLEGTAGDTGPGPASPVHVRKILSKNHGQSDDDDEGLFSSEVSRSDDEFCVLYLFSAELSCMASHHTLLTSRMCRARQSLTRYLLIFTPFIPLGLTEETPDISGHCRIGLMKQLGLLGSVFHPELSLSSLTRDMGTVQMLRL